MNVESESIKTTLATYADALTGIVGILIFVYTLELSELGVYYILTAVNQIATRPVRGISTANEHYTRSGGAEGGAYFGSTIGISLFVNTVIAVLVVSAHGIGATRMIGVETSAIGALVGLIFTTSLFEVARGSYSGRYNPSTPKFIDALTGLVQTILQVTVVLLGYGVTMLIVTTAVSYIIGFVILYSQLSVAQPRLGIIVRLVEFGKWSSITEVADSIFDSIDPIALGYLITPAIAGGYSAVVRITQGVGYVGLGLQKPVLVYTSTYDERCDELYEKVSHIGSYATVLAIPVLAGGLVVGFDVLTLYDEHVVSDELLPAMYYPLLLASTVYFGLNSHNRILMELNHGLRNPKFVTKATVISTIVRVIGVIILTVLYGLNGLIVAMLLSISIRFVILQHSHEYVPRRIVYQIAPAIVMMGVVSIIPSNTVVAVGIGAVTYLTVLTAIDRSIRSYVQE